MIKFLKGEGYHFNLKELTESEWLLRDEELDNVVGGNLLAPPKCYWTVEEANKHRLFK